MKYYIANLTTGFKDSVPHTVIATVKGDRYKHVDKPIWDPGDRLKGLQGMDLPHDNIVDSSRVIELIFENPHNRWD
jgi:hypothetical protein